MEHCHIEGLQYSLKWHSKNTGIMHYAHTINGDNGCGTIHYDDRGVVRTIRVGQIECQATRDVASILEGQWIELDRAVEDKHSITGIIRCIQQGDVETAIRH